MSSVSRGTLYRIPRSKNWFIKFYIDGRTQRETTGTPDRGLAEAFLTRRIDEAKRGVFHPPSERVTFEQMTELLLRIKTGSIFRRYLIVDEELLAQATGAVADYLEQAQRADDLPRVEDALRAANVPMAGDPDRTLRAG